MCGVVLAEPAQLRRASAALPGSAHDRRTSRRAQRLLAHLDLDLARAHRRRCCAVAVAAPLPGAAGSAAGCHDTGPPRTARARHGHSAGTRCFAVAWQHRAVPLIWRVGAAVDGGRGGMCALRSLH